MSSPTGRRTGRVTVVFMTAASTLAITGLQLVQLRTAVETQNKPKDVLSAVNTHMAAVTKALEKMAKDLAKDPSPLDESDAEDVHSFVESELGKRVGSCRTTEAFGTTIKN